MGDATKVDMDAWDRDMRINVTSMVLMSRHAIPEMRKNGRGAIVNISSVSGREYTIFGRPKRRSNSLSSPRRQPELAVPNDKGSYHSDDPRDGRTPRQREYQSQLHLSRNGVHSNGKMAHARRREPTKVPRWSKSHGKGRNRMGCWIRFVVFPSADESELC